MYKNNSSVKGEVCNFFAFSVMKSFHWSAKKIFHPQILAINHNKLHTSYLSIV